MPYADEAKNRAATMVWRQNNPEATARIARRCNRKTKAKAIAMLGGCCVVCGESDLRLLTINHKNGDGYKERQSFGTNPDGIAMYRTINSGQRSLEDLDVRCYNHNILYEYEIGRRQWDEE